MAHEADTYIASQWMNKTVKQVKGDPKLVGRAGVVVETFWDEKGALHCKIDDYETYFWAPASVLEIIY